MNAVEIEEAISDLALQPFDAAEFPFEFLAAFGNKETTLKRLRTGNSNKSDISGGVLQSNNVHIAVSEAGCVGETLKALRASQPGHQQGNLRKRMAHIRIFDPACGSGNFLVIAYKQMREIEAESTAAGVNCTWAARYVRQTTLGRSLCRV